jgi:hypothetical protein
LQNDSFSGGKGVIQLTKLKELEGEKEFYEV